MSRWVTSAGRNFIQNLEGVRLKAYYDEEGRPTIGYGHLIKPGDGFNIESAITPADASRLFIEDLRPFEFHVDDLVKVQTTWRQFNALVSFAYNIGIGGFEGSTLLELLNLGNYQAVPTQMSRWVKLDNGQTSPGLVARRLKEGDLFKSPVTSTMK